MKFNLLILVIIFVATISVARSHGCTPSPGQQLTPAQKYDHFRQHYLFVKIKQAVNRRFNHTQINDRVRLLAGTREGTSLCPWTWAIDEDVNRIPRYLAKAECPSCNHYCRAVFYSHSTLGQRCDRTTGEVVWKMMEKTLEIAYLFDP